jgi:hypothetical protein
MKEGYVEDRYSEVLDDRLGSHLGSDCGGILIVVSGMELMLKLAV